LLVRKPGFFNHQELGRWIVPETSADVSSGSSAIVKLTPEGIIYGEVKDAEGAPLGLTVRAERWQMSDGRHQLQPDRQTMTDDQGNFRLAELVPGKYLLAFLPPDSGGIVRRGLRPRKSGDEGLASSSIRAFPTSLPPFPSPFPPAPKSTSPIPGKYRLLAVQDDWNLDWRDPAVLKRYLTKALPLQIAPNESKKLTLEAQTKVK